MVLCGVLAVAGSGALPVRAQEVTSMGAGSRMSCAGWLEARRTGVLEHSVMNWALGYISGAAYHGTIGDPLGPVDIHGVRRWLDSFCASNPARDLAGAIDVFIAESRPE